MGFKSFLRSRGVYSKSRDPSVIPHLYSSCWAAPPALCSCPWELKHSPEAETCMPEQDWLFQRRDADGLWKRALCCPFPTVSLADPLCSHGLPWATYSAAP